MPDISVIVVTYNQESTIARCLESIVAQRFNGRIEIVIGEDGSMMRQLRYAENIRQTIPTEYDYIATEGTRG